MPAGHATDTAANRVIPRKPMFLQGKTRWWQRLAKRGKGVAAGGEGFPKHGGGRAFDDN
jgi:hypothetical protein